jgi:chemotaxis protein histidine kinase CheA
VEAKILELIADLHTFLKEKNKEEVKETILAIQRYIKKNVLTFAGKESDTLLRPEVAKQVKEIFDNASKLGVEIEPTVENRVVASIEGKEEEKEEVEEKPKKTKKKEEFDADEEAEKTKKTRKKEKEDWEESSKGYHTSDDELEKKAKEHLKRHKGEDVDVDVSDLDKFISSKTKKK